jgi:WD40 repeat protein
MNEFLIFFLYSLPLLIYPSGKFVVVKNYLNPSECFVYRGHAANPTVAKFSPNGFWVASGDTAGKVRVWSWDNPEHLTKLETPVFNGCIYDLDWDNESKKLVAAGDGSGLLVKCFTWDTGNSAGEMTGHTKRVRSISYKPSRPFKVMTGGEDMRTLFYAGPPFKLDHSNAPHTNFVNCVRYSSNGNKIISVGSDKKIQLYDGTTGQPEGEINNAHEGGIYSASFSPDGSFFVTASADKTLKLWNTSTLALEQTFVCGADPQLGDMQVACLWHKESILSVSLNGNINVFSRANTSAPERVVFAHQVAITSMIFDSHSNQLFSGSYDGVVLARQIGGSFDAVKFSGGDKKNLSNAIHAGKVVGMIVQGDNLMSIGWDDKIRFASITTKNYHSEQALNGQPIALAGSTTSDMVIVITNAEVSCFRGTNKVWTQATSSFGYTPTCCALYNDNELAIGGSDSKTHIYTVSGSSISETNTIETRSAVSALSYSANGASLAIGDVGRQVEVYDRSSWTARVKGKWVNHTSRITSLSWSPSGDRLASGSLDENIYIWNLSKPNSFSQFPFSHSGGVSGVQWMDDNRLVSVGNDHATVTWKIPPIA